jgi:UDP-N-acetylglucosamine--N-acetylmuramyl-(pentapeptide) pyrophosphoryl-undecaprenol N-acetylglucosamine transferase
VEQAVAQSGLKQIRVIPFISKMECAYNVADVIVSRAGAITISELCVIGKPAILVPSPNVAEDHQTRNAEALADRNAAVMIHDRDAMEELVEAMLKLVKDEGRQKELSDNIKQMAIPDASQRIAREVLKIMESK